MGSHPEGQWCGNVDSKKEGKGVVKLKKVDIL